MDIPAPDNDRFTREVNIDDAIDLNDRGISRASYRALHRNRSGGLAKSLREKYEQKGTPTPKPRLSRRARTKDENSNDVLSKDSSSSSEECYRTIVLRSESEESLGTRVAKELSMFTMDPNPKKKKIGSFRRILTGKIFTKEKRRKEEDKGIQPHKENVRNETNDFNRQSNVRHTIGGNNPSKDLRQLEERYAQMHIREFNHIKNNFENLQPKVQERPAPRPVTYRAPKFDEVSSSASTLTSEDPYRNDTAQEEMKLVNTNALPNPYQEHLGKTDDEVYYRDNRPSQMKRSPSIEVSKLKLPPNRDAIILSARVKSPIPQDCNNTDKEIATELLKPKRSPTSTPQTPSSSADMENQYMISVQNRENQGISRIPTMRKEYQDPNQISPIAPTYGSSAIGQDYVRRRNSNLYKNLPPCSTPNNLTPPPKSTTSPQKEELRRSVEAYYWKEIKKLKEQENMELYYYQMNMYAEQSADLRRSRSMSPAGSRNGRRSLSLPRNVTGSSNDPNGNRQVVIPEGKPTIYQNEPTYEQFRRNTPQRRTIDGVARANTIYRPIFKRGSLTTPVRQPEDLQYKKVSFSHFDESSPRRRDYPVRLQPRPNDDVYRNANEIYQRFGDPMYVPYMHQLRHRTAPISEDPQNIPRSIDRHSSMQLHQQDSIYGRRPPPMPRRTSYDAGVNRGTAGGAPKREIIMTDNEIFGQFGGYLPNEEASYSGSVVSTQDSIYGQYRGPKQISVSDKVCDIYGQIHDRDSPSVVRKSGVMMGRLQQPPQSVDSGYPHYLQRNSRLTASASDMRTGRYPGYQAPAYPSQPTQIYRGGGFYSEAAPSRPLPPVPGDPGRIPPKYGTVKESANGGGTKPKKKAFFGSKHKQSLEHLETEESRQLSTAELQRLVLLEQLHLIRLQKRLQTE